MNKKISIPHLSFFSEVKQSLQLSLPLIASQLSYAITVFVSTWIMAHLGRDVLAAAGLADVIWIALIASSMGTLSATSILISQYFGGNKPSDIQLVASQSILFGCLIIIPVMLILWFIPVILPYLGKQDAHIIQLVTKYLHAMVWCIPPLALLVTIEQFLIGIHKTKVVLYISILLTCAEISSTYSFVLGKFGLPAYGIAGFGYGLTLTYIIATIFIGLFLYRSKTC